MSDEARNVAARIGIVALNLIAPGLGLLRVQAGRAAVMLLLAPLGLLALVILAYLILPTLTFASWATLVGFALVALLAIYLIAIVISWRLSARRLPSGPWWSRWYGMAAILLVMWTFTALLPDFTQSTYKAFYIPSEAMLPTFEVGDRIVARMGQPGSLSRGDIVLVSSGASIYVKRVAGLPGDRIAMQDGIVQLNGQAVAQRIVGGEHVQPDQYGNTVRRLSEQFPGEASPHEIFDAGDSPGDEYGEVTIPAGYVFLLGDNRDHSADSRYPRAEMGLGGPVPLNDLRGTPAFFYWTTGRHRIGDSASH